MKNALLDKVFLKELDAVHLKEIYARVISLDFNESPIEELQGRVTDGNISLDAASAVRRTCSLTIQAQDLNITNFYWGITHKFKLEIGVSNNINSNYPDIIWFPQGIYVITSFNITQSTSALTVQITGKDKMVFLNGDMGGVIPIQTQFDCYAEEAVDQTGTSLANVKIPVKTIITNLVHQYGNESMQNIVINDIGDYGLNQVRYAKTDYKYLLKQNSSDYDTVEYYPKFFTLTEFASIAGIGQNTINSLKTIQTAQEKVSNATEQIAILEKQLESSTLTSEDQNEIEEQIAEYESIIEKNQDIVDNYAVLRDAILGDSFKFDNGVNSIDNTPSEIVYEGKTYTVREITYGTDVGYTLTDLIYDEDLIANVGESVTSVLDKIVNKFGEYEYFYNLDGKFIFQRKASYINSSWNSSVTYENQTYIESMMTSSAVVYSFENGNIITNYQNTPNLLNLKNDFCVWGEKNNTNKTPIHMRYAIHHKPTYYMTIDKQVYTTQDSNSGVIEENAHYGVDWREIIYQMALDFQNHNGEDDFIYNIMSNNGPLYPGGHTGYEQYYTDMIGYWRTIYNEDGTWVSTSSASSIIDDPESLIFWFDFLEASGELQKYSAQAIGSRMKAANESSVKAIHYAEIPTFIFYDRSLYQEEQTSQLYSKTSDELKNIIDSQFTGYVDIPLLDYGFKAEDFIISTESVSAKDKIDTYLYNYACCADSISLTCLPIYYLEPNTRISVSNSESGISGEYLISKMTIPLNYSGTMLINATKAVDRLY